ncbi:5-methylaminomethyl-2-thiouridylate-methyltransferase [Ramaria rubella]|nr:5-methylaminomethyl-2-thiouridylate-methyltransferase [Ramaria rubella]
MSGGVDSSVAALILSQKDYDLSALYMRNWDTHDESGSEIGCEWEKDWEDVQRVCSRLHLPCELIDLSTQYWTRVFEPALKDWEDGCATPNPDIWCNREIKFGLLMEKALRNGGNWLATGHYANIAWSLDGRPRLMRGRDCTKDQTFFLSSVPEASLYKALFPLGTLLKSDVREIAHRADLPTARRKESMGICFVGEKRRFNDFLAQYLPPKPGDIVSLDGKVLAQHQGLWRYTIGQGAKIRGLRERMFVALKDPALNQILVVPGSNHPALFRKSIVMRDWNWVQPDFQPPSHFRAHVQIRHLMSAVPCCVEESQPGNLKITFEQPEKAVAPGQVAVIWDQDWCLGCGTIAETFQ